VLTEIDLRATLRDKLGEDMEDYLILGACNPLLTARSSGNQIMVNGNSHYPPSPSRLRPLPARGLRAR
jgi:hypothetical protein